MQKKANIKGCLTKLFFFLPSSAYEFPINTIANCSFYPVTLAHFDKNYDFCSIIPTFPITHMKYLIVSDIHGSLPRLEQVLTFFDTQHYDMLLILGDILNYGPRNGVPEGLDAPGIVNRLNAVADRIVAVRGNCDAEVDQMLLHFPCLADYSILISEGKRIMLTHGHLYNEDHRSSLNIDALIYGHTHLWKLDTANDGVVICNTGSITFPKGGNIPTFATLDEGNLLRIRDLDGQIIKELSIGSK